MSADILWYDSDTGETQIWFMNGHRIDGLTPHAVTITKCPYGAI
jgi:hypothetical protein